MLHSDNTLDLILERKEFKLKERCRETSGLTVSLSKRYGQRLKSPARRKVGAFIESSVVQKIILVLFLFDIALVLTELILESAILANELAVCQSGCHDLQHESNHTRRKSNYKTLASSDALRMRRSGKFRGKFRGKKREETTTHNSTIDDLIAYCESTEASLHIMEEAAHILHWISISVLCLFMLELVILFICFGYFFFLHLLYIIDFFIVGLSLGLELGLSSQYLQDAIAVIIFLRLWRMIRAGK